MREYPLTCHGNDNYIKRERRSIKYELNYPGVICPLIGQTTPGNILKTKIAI